MTVAGIRTCTKCGSEKPATAEFFLPSRGGKLRAECRVCSTAYQRDYRARDPAKWRSYNATYERSPETDEQRSQRLRVARAWHHSHRDTANATSRRYYADRRTERIAKAMRWRAENRSRYLEIQRKAKERRRERIGYRLRDAVSSSIYHSLKGMKAGRGWESLVGYDLASLVSHLERQFFPKMSWENYGPVWHIDHIVPLSKFTFTSPDDADFRSAWALTNLRPLWSLDNIRKGAKRTLLL